MTSITRMKKEQRWEQRYEVPTANGNWSEKVVYPKSEEQKNSNIQKIRECGYRLISCKKLYPFSTEKNQHNFMLIKNICSNRIFDMSIGDIEYDEAEIERLEAIEEKADKYFSYPLPIAWVTWEEHQEMKELSMMAVNYRIDTCIENGRNDLVHYC